MSDFDSHCQRLFAAFDAGEPAPADLIGRLSDDEAYQAQVMMLKRRVGAGHKHIGWKIGQTNRQMREERGEHQPAPGFLLRADRHEDGYELAMGGADNWYLEPELAVCLGEDLAISGVTDKEVQGAIETVAPAFELVRTIKSWSDRALLRAVNGATSGIVLGEGLSAAVSCDELDDLRIRLVVDGSEYADVRGGDVNDNPLESIAWLANYLGGLGEQLKAGQIILAGSYAGLVPMSPGQAWTATIGNYGSVSLTTD